MRILVDLLVTIEFFSLYKLLADSLYPYKGYLQNNSIQKRKKNPFLKFSYLKTNNVKAQQGIVNVSVAETVLQPRNLQNRGARPLLWIQMPLRPVSPTYVCTLGTNLFMGTIRKRKSFFFIYMFTIVRRASKEGKNSSF